MEAVAAAVAAAGDKRGGEYAMRYRLDMSYVGTRYHGWQRQENAVTVEGVLEEAFRRVTGFGLEVVGVGRTDSGVHAEQYVAHVDLPAACDPIKLRYKLNAVLPRDVGVHAIRLVPDNFHARYDAVRRTYEYRIMREKMPFLEDRAFFCTWPLDVPAMQRAALSIKGEREFGCFCKAGGDTHSMRCRVDESYWREEGSLLIYRVSADRFLRNMVRAIVGTLLEVGRGKRDEDMRALLDGGCRSAAGESVPGCGLFLVKVEY